MWGVFFIAILRSGKVNLLLGLVSNRDEVDPSHLFPDSVPLQNFIKKIPSRTPENISRELLLLDDDMQINIHLGYSPERSLNKLAVRVIQVIQLLLTKKVGTEALLTYKDAVFQLSIRLMRKASIVKLIRKMTPAQAVEFLSKLRHEEHKIIFDAFDNPAEKIWLLEKIDHISAQILFKGVTAEERRPLIPRISSERLYRLWSSGELEEEIKALATDSQRRDMANFFIRKNGVDTTVINKLLGIS